MLSLEIILYFPKSIKKGRNIMATVLTHRFSGIYWIQPLRWSTILALITL